MPTKKRGNLRGVGQGTNAVRGRSAARIAESIAAANSTPVHITKTLISTVNELSTEVRINNQSSQYSNALGASVILYEADGREQLDTRYLPTPGAESETESRTIIIPNDATSAEVNAIIGKDNLGRFISQDVSITIQFSDSPTRDISGITVVDKGGGKVGITVTDHGMSPGHMFALEGTTNYNNAYYFTDTDTTTNEIVFLASYVAETFAANSVVRIAQRFTSTLFLLGLFTTNALVFLRGNPADVGLTKSKKVMLQFDQHGFNVRALNGIRLKVDYLKMCVATTAEYKALWIQSNTNTVDVGSCYFVGTSDANGVGIYYEFSRGFVQNCYFSNIKYGIYSFTAGEIVAAGNDDDLTLPGTAYYMRSGTIRSFLGRPNGQLFDYAVTRGGEFHE